MIWMIAGSVYYLTDSTYVATYLSITFMALFLLYIAVCMFTFPDVHRAFAKASAYILAVVIFILALLLLVNIFKNPYETLDSDDPPHDLDKHMKISVSMVYLIIYAGVFIAAALVYPREFLCNLQSLWYLLCLPGFNIFLITYTVVNMAKTNEGMFKLNKCSTVPSNMHLSKDFLIAGIPYSSYSISRKINLSLLFCQTSREE